MGNTKKQGKETSKNFNFFWKEVGFL